MKTIYLGMIWCVQILYAGLTLCYLAPDNPLKVYLIKPLGYFKDAFYQNWSFFAPPPVSELKVYVLIDLPDDEPGSKNIVLDLSGHLSDQKRRVFPFSWKENFNEYVLGGAAQGQLRGISTFDEKFLIIEEFWDLDDDEATFLRKKMAEGHTELRSTNTLKEYCRKVVKAMSIELPEGRSECMRYALVSYSYPKFIDRYRDDITPQMSLHYLSEAF